MKNSENFTETELISHAALAKQMRNIPKTSETTKIELCMDDHSTLNNSYFNNEAEGDLDMDIRLNRFETMVMVDDQVVCAQTQEGFWYDHRCH